MASLRDYYDTDFARCLKLGRTLHMDVLGRDQPYEVIANLCIDMDSTGYFLSYYFPEFHDPVGAISSAVGEWLEFTTVVSAEMCAWVGNASQKAVGPYQRVFCRVMYAYYVGAMNAAQLAALATVAEHHNIRLLVRDEQYRSMRAESEQPSAFLSHDSRDKELIVRPIAQALAKRLFPVWYDEYSLKIGDSLRESIERGIKNAQKCILILSPNFLSNSGWSKAEFDSIYQKEIVEGKHVILPVWVDLTKQQVYEYSPRLVDRVAHIWSGDPEAAAAKIIEVMKR